MSERARCLLRATVLGACLGSALVVPALPSDALAKKSTVAKGDVAEVTFLGYQALSGGRGLLFVDLSRAVEVEVNRSGAVIEYRLLGASVPRRNNKNPLLLQNFASSALTAVLIPEKVKGKAHAPPSVRFVVTLRGKVQPQHRVVGYGKGARLEIELPAPTGS